jgi:predicted RNA-binding protein YlxR (DUF448 family)
LNLATLAKRNDENLRERKCIATGEVLPGARLMRFVVGPDGSVVPDVAAALPGRGIWVKADRDALAQAIEKGLFSKAAKAGVRAGADLLGRTEKLLVDRMTSDLGLARRAGQLVFGFDNVANALRDKTPPAVLVEARDGAMDGKRKLLALAHARKLAVEIVECLDSGEISLALGRENVIHAALKSGRISERLVMDAGRLKGFRASDSAGPTPAIERDE